VHCLCGEDGEVAAFLRPALPMYAGRPTGARTHGRSLLNRRTFDAPAP
jgi:hypothetical protein